MKKPTIAGALPKINKKNVTPDSMRYQAQARKPKVAKGPTIAGATPKVKKGSNITAESIRYQAQAPKKKSTASKVVSRAKTVAREVRDIPTAVGTAVRATAGRNPGFRKDFAVDQLKKQVKEVKTAAKSGAKGSRGYRYTSVNPNKNR
jgi:hypothetical protein